MKKEEIQALFAQFEQVSCVLNDVECWSARELCSLLGYKLWQNFTEVIDKAKEACVNVGQKMEDHFIDANKMVVIGSGAERQIDDIMLTRYACVNVQTKDLLVELPNKIQEMIDAIANILGIGFKGGLNNLAMIKANIEKEAGK